jgi:hypothetical protein
MSVETHEGVHRHPAPTGFIRKYIFSVDHKVIGIQYIMLALAAVVVGMIMSLLMRLNLSWPNRGWPILETLFPTGAPGGVMTPEFYLSLVTMHGTIMVFFVLTTAPQGGFGNYFLPIQIGAEDMAFPTLNMLSFWVTLVGFIVILLAIFADGLCAFERAGQDRRAGPGRRHEPVGHQYRDLLHRLSPGRVEFHHDAAEHAHERHVVDAHAVDVLGVVYHRRPGVVVVPGAAGRRHSVAARSHRGNQLFYSKRIVRERIAFRHKSELPVAHRRLTDPLAAPLLVLRPS